MRINTHLLIFAYIYQQFPFSFLFTESVVRAMGNLIGYVNNHDIPKALLLAEITPGLQKTSITGFVKNIPKNIGKFFNY